MSDTPMTPTRLMACGRGIALIAELRCVAHDVEDARVALLRLEL